MPRGNTVPTEADGLSRLIARVENLERFFKPGGPDSLEALTDVDISNPLDNDVLTYVAADGKWENKPASGGGAGFPVGPHDDGTATHEIQTGFPFGGALLFSTTANDGESVAEYVQTADAGSGGSGSAAFLWATQNHLNTSQLELGMGVDGAGDAQYDMAGSGHNGAGFGIEFLTQTISGNAASSGQIFAAIPAAIAAQLIFGTIDTLSASMSMEASVASGGGASVGVSTDASGNGTIVLQGRFGTPAVIDIGAAGDVVSLSNLPTSDPHLDGQAYLDGYVSGVTPGTVKVSAG